MPRDFTPAIDCTSEERPRILLKPVTSNQVAAIGYDPATKTLAATFTRGQGHIYHYPDVEPEQACAFFMADSLGKHFGQHIAKLPSKKYAPDMSAIVGDGPTLNTENPDHGEHLAAA